MITDFIAVQELINEKVLAMRHTSLIHGIKDLGVATKALLSEGFIIYKSDYERDVSLTLQELEIELLDLIDKNCQHIENDKISILRAKNDIARKSMRGIPQVYDNILAYKGSATTPAIDTGIIIVSLGEDKYSYALPKGWQQYYRVID